MTRSRGKKPPPKPLRPRDDRRPARPQQTPQPQQRSARTPQAAPAGSTTTRDRIPSPRRPPPPEPAPVDQRPTPPGAPPQQSPEPVRSRAPFLATYPETRRYVDRRSVAAVVGLVVGSVLALGTAVLTVPRLFEPTVPAPSDQTTVARFVPPAPLRPGDEYVRTRVLPTGDLRVEHWIDSRSLVFHLTLARPLTSGVDGSRVVARSVQIEADGQTVIGPETVRTRQDFDFLGAHRVHLAYTLSGALSRSSVIDRRALVQAVALRVTVPGRRPPHLRYAVAGNVLALACAGPSPRAVPRPCGREARGGWRVDLGRPARPQRVIAQVDLL